MPAPPPRCPAALACRWHDRVQAWLKMGQLDQIREQADVMHVLIGRAWHNCRCGLVPKVKALL